MGVTPEGYDAVRRAWLTHVHAEEVLFKPFTEDEFNTQMKVMLSVFTDDCVMELATSLARLLPNANFRGGSKTLQ
jgi:hypothetical protein